MGLQESSGLSRVPAGPWGPMAAPLPWRMDCSSSVTPPAGLGPDSGAVASVLLSPGAPASPCVPRLDPCLPVCGPGLSQDLLTGVQSARAACISGVCSSPRTGSAEGHPLCSFQDHADPGPGPQAAVQIKRLSLPHLLPGGGRRRQESNTRLPRWNLPRSCCLPAPITAAPSPRLPLLPARPPPRASGSLPVFSGGHGVRRAHLGPCLTLASVYTQCYYSDTQNKEHFIRNGAFSIGQLSCSAIRPPSALRGSILTRELRLF
ncbi:uncharacterized protein LOC122709296 [Cervus elaphus]|uniref:uncharacterized protein LOC122709296 n=1 Tax=Cervus elaphus TaxID=9860 RepID=UPI001CC322B3|nr:uncharacterized protein LOC122709296 [Cervus elaphus]